MSARGNGGDLRNLWHGAVRNSVHSEGRPAVLGRVDGTVYFTDDSGVTHFNRVWIRYTDTNQPIHEAVVHRRGIAVQVGMPLVIKNIGGSLFAFLKQEGSDVDVFTNNGEVYPAPAHSHFLAGPNPDYVEGKRFMPLGVRPSDPPGLTVYVNPGWYRYNGVWDSWEGGDTGSLAAYVPAAGTVHFVIVALDRETNAITLIDGDDVNITDPIFGYEGPATDDEIAAIAVATKYRPLAAVHLFGGQTQILVKDITNDLRLWGGEAGLDINGLTEDTAPDAAADYIITYDDSAGTNKKVLIDNLPGPAGNVVMLFSQTADKTVANTTTPTDLIGTGVGSVTLPAGLLEIGTAVRLSLAGHVSTTGTPTLDFAVTLGGTELASTGANALGSSISNVGWKLFLDIVCRTTGATGTVVASGFVRLGEELFGLVKTTTTTVDTTGTLAIAVPAEWGTNDVANTATCQTTIIEHLAGI